MNIERLYRDYGIPTAPTGHKHWNKGWINAPCPFCTGNPGYHLGYHVSKEYFHCFRCGKKQTEYALKALFPLSNAELKNLISLYGNRPKNRLQAKFEGKNRLSKVVFPDDCHEELNPLAEKYLIDRNFKPQKLIKKWNLRSTGKFGPYKFRLIAPIYHYSKIVSYQGRDYTGKAELKYKACPKKFELIEHQSLLYGADKIQGDSVVLVEGITDVWRLGYGAVCCFGIDFTPFQIVRLTNYKQVIIMFDSDPQAIQQMDKLAGYLDGAGIEVVMKEMVGGDPAELTQKEANKFMKTILGGNL